MQKEGKSNPRRWKCTGPRVFLCISVLDVNIAFFFFILWQVKTWMAEFSRTQNMYSLASPKLFAVSSSIIQFVFNLFLGTSRYIKGKGTQNPYYGWLLRDHKALISYFLIRLSERRDKFGSKKLLQYSGQTYRQKHLTASDSLEISLRPNEWSVKCKRK